MLSSGDYPLLSKRGRERETGSRAAVGISRETLFQDFTPPPPTSLKKSNQRPLPDSYSIKQLS